MTVLYYVHLYSTGMYDVIMTVGGAILLRKYPLKPQTKMEHFGILAVLLCWTLTRISGDLVTNVHCGLSYTILNGGAGVASEVSMGFSNSYS